jgi:hypothetical protein
MRRFLLRAAATAAFSAFLPISTAFAHCFIGGRFLPATLNVDDPCVNDELSLPTVSRFKTGDDPAVRETDISGEISKRITETFGVSIGSAWTHLRPPGGPNASGFQNLETTAKWQFLTLPEQEFVMSAGLSVEWGGSGAQGVGAERFSAYTPTVWFGKGLGDLPVSLSYLRPFAITGQVGYSIPSSAKAVTVTIDPDTGDQSTDTEFHPRVLRWGGSIQYSMPYLKSSVIDLGLPDFIDHLIPIVEAQLQTPVGNTFTSGTLTTGTVNPGVIWVGNYYQVGIEAIIPINRASGTGIGWMAQLHMYLDDIFPRTIGQPIFGAATPTRLPFGGQP